MPYARASQTSGCAADDARDLGSILPVVHGARPSGLESPLHVEVTIRFAVRLVLAAEVEVLRQGVTKGPAAVVGQKSGHRLSLAEGDFQVVGPERHRCALISLIRQHSTKPCRKVAAFWLPPAPGTAILQIALAAALGEVGRDADLRQVLSRTCSAYTH